MQRASTRPGTPPSRRRATPRPRLVKVLEDSGDRSTVHVRVDHQHDHERARLRVEEGQRARPVVDGVREDAAARALLRPPRRLRLHRDDGRGARRGRARARPRPRSGCTPSTSGTARRGSASSSPRSNLAKIDMSEVNEIRIGARRRRATRSSCGSGTPASPCTGATRSARSRPTSRPTSSRSSGPTELLAQGRRRAPRARRRSRRRARRCWRSPAASVRSCSSVSSQEGSKAKPPRASLFKSMDPDTVDLETALKLLSLPRVVGADADGQRDHRAERSVRARTSRRAPTAAASRPRTRSSRARSRRPRRSSPSPSSGAASRPKAPIAELGESPDTGKPVRVLDGRFGPYVTDGTTNATIRRGLDPDEFTLEDAIDLLRERAAQGAEQEEGAGEEGGQEDREEDGQEEGRRRRPAKKTAVKKKRVVKKGTSAGDRSRRSRSGPRRRRVECARSRRRRLSPTVPRSEPRRSDPAPFIPPLARGAPDPAESVAALRDAAVLQALARAGLLEPRRLGRVLRDPRLTDAAVSNDSAAAFSLVIGVRMVPGFFLATLGGVIVDRFDRRKVMVLLRPRPGRADLRRCRSSTASGCS